MGLLHSYVVESHLAVSLFLFFEHGKGCVGVVFSFGLVVPLMNAKYMLPACRECLVAYFYLAEGVPSNMPSGFESGPLYLCCRGARDKLFLAFAI